MKPRTTLVLITCAALFALLLACTLTPAPISPGATVVTATLPSAARTSTTQPSVALTPVTMLPKVSPGATMAAVASSIPLVSATPTLKPTRTPIVIQMQETALPLSYFALTMTITATVTDLKVGDVTTVTVTTTNTGKLGAHQTYCYLVGYVDLGTPQPFNDPILTPAAKQIDSSDIGPGDVQTCTFVLQGVRPGTVLLQGGYGGKVYFSVQGGDVYAGEKSPLLRINVIPANP